VTASSNSSISPSPGEPSVVDVAVSPAFAAYRDDPRMAELRQRIGLP
jgi:hypothetical protein